jgi:hypothetical protein
MSNDNLPKLPEYGIENAFRADQMTTYGAACYAMGRGAAVRDYINTGEAVAASGAGVPDVDARNICEINRSSDQGVTVKFMSARAASKFILELGALWDTSLLAAAPTPDHATKAG